MAARRVTQKLQAGTIYLRRSFCLLHELLLTIRIRKHVIHTVGPVFAKSKEEEKAEQLASCYRRCLEICMENSLKSIVSPPDREIRLLTDEAAQAFPSISTGVYGYPIESATLIALGETRKFLDQPQIHVCWLRCLQTYAL